MPGDGDPHARTATATRPSSSPSAPRRRSTCPSPSSATSRRPTPAPHKHLVEFRDEAGELTVGESVTVAAFEEGQTVKVSGTSKGKGFQGTIKRHNFSARPQVARLAQRPRPRLDRRLGVARPRDEGHPRPRPDGQQARDAEGPGGRAHRRRAEPAACSAARSRARATAWWRCAPMARRARPRRHQEGQARRRRLRRALQRAARPRVRARGAQRAPPGHARRRRRAARSAAVAPSRGARRAPAAPAPARSRSPIWTGGGIVFGPSPRHYTFKVNKKEKRAALRSALSVHAERGSIAVLDPAPFETPSTKQAAKLIADWGAQGSVLVVLTDAEERVALSFRNIDRVSRAARRRPRRRRPDRRRQRARVARRPWTS